MRTETSRNHGARGAPYILAESVIITLKEH